VDIQLQNKILEPYVMLFTTEVTFNSVLALRNLIPCR